MRVRAYELSAIFFIAAFSAEAQPEVARTSSLSWVRTEGAESCIGTKELASKIEAVLERAIFVSATDADISIEGRIGQPPNGVGWKAVLQVSNARGESIGTRDVQTES